MAAQRGVYTVAFIEQSITAANTDYDLFEFVPADDRPIELVAFNLGVTGEVGDAQDETLTIKISTDFTVSSNGTSTTPRPCDPRDGAAGFTAETVGATVANTGTEIILMGDSFNVRAGGTWIFPEQMRFKVDQGDTGMYIRMMSTVADTLTMSGTAWVREL
jgi:hypothetical protein